MANLPPELQQLVDRQQIYDCIVRYCSGVDRFDREMLRAVYHDDAMDDHGAFVGTADEFCDWALAYHAKYQHHHKHFVLNHRCELDASGKTAHTETYWIFSGKNKIGPALTLSGGRYLDRFEKRAGRWAIAARKCIIEWIGDVNETAVPKEAWDVYALTGTPQRDKSDPSYMRPLEVTRGKFVAPF